MDSYWHSSSANSGQWFPYSHSCENSDHCAIFVLLVAAVHSLLGVFKNSIEFTLQLTYNLGTL